MSHYVVFVAIPGNVDLEGEEWCSSEGHIVDELLAPFSEHLEVDPYVDKETGETTTRNPDAKWDWYVIGGRWGGYFEKYAADPTGDLDTLSIDKVIEGVESYKSYNKVQLEGKCCPLPMAFVTAQSDWYAKGEVGWFAIISCETDEDKYIEGLLGLMRKQRDDFGVKHLVVVDLHI